MSDIIATTYCEGGNEAIINYTYQDPCKLIVIDIDTYNEAISNQTPIENIPDNTNTDLLAYFYRPNSSFDYGTRASWEFVEYDLPSWQYKVSVSALDVGDSGETVTADLYLGYDYRENLTVELREYFFSGLFAEYWETHWTIVAPNGQSRMSYKHSNGRLEGNKPATFYDNFQILSIELKNSWWELKTYSDGEFNRYWRQPSIINLQNGELPETRLKAFLYSDATQPLNGNLMPIKQGTETIDLNNFNDKLVIKRDIARNLFTFPYIIPPGYRGTKYIFTEKSYPLPTINVVCDYSSNTNNCPPNTCAVLCGDTVCCYGSNGIAVSSYPYDRN